MICPSYYNPAKVIDPRKEPLDLLSSSVPPQLPPILRFGPFSVLPMGRDHLDTLRLQLSIELVTVIRPVPNELLGFFLNKPVFDRVLHQHYFMPVSTLEAYGDRKTSAVCNCHDLPPFAPLRISNPWAPFFAGTKVPSMIYSFKSKSPRSFKSLAVAFGVDPIVPFRTHDWNRRWQVWYGEYRSGRYCQGAPVRRIHKIPLSTSLDSLQGLPFPSALFGNVGSNDFITSHCSSVRSMVPLQSPSGENVVYASENV
jgi:hypothetical protein